MQITEQEAWTERDAGQIELSIPDYVREVVEEVAFQARQDQKVDKRSGVSQRLPISLLENVVSNAERRALATGEPVAVPRITDIYAAHPGDHRQVRARVRRRAEGGRQRRARADPQRGRDRLRRLVPERRPPAGHRVVRPRRQPAGRRRAAGGRARRRGRRRCRGCTKRRAPAVGEAPGRAAPRSAIDFVLEGLYAQRKISRSVEGQFQAAEQAKRPVADDGSADASASCR